MSCCNICTEDFTKKNPCVTCPQCEIGACRECCGRYILDQRIGKCMNNNCKIEWTRQFMAKTFSKQWMSKEWKNMRENVLFDREKALLPATQPIVAERLQQDLIIDEIRELDNLMKELKHRRFTLELKLNHGTSTAPRQKTNNFVRACPGEDCRGYLDIRWKCGLCNKQACKECHQIVDNASTHECNPDDVATAKLLDADTKPCPKCSTGIFKIAGCDQMWCTQCHTAFDWKTGNIESNIHNPHYFEYLRRTNGAGAPRNQGDHYVCGETITNGLARSIWLQLQHFGRERELISRTIETTLHLRDVELRKYRTDQAENNLELRIEYLRGKITEETFKVKVQRANKAFDKKREIFQVADLLQRTITEILLRMNRDLRIFLPEDITKEQANQYISEINGIVDYVNECLHDISNTYGSKKMTASLYTGIKGNVYTVKGREQWTRNVIH